MHEIEDDTPPDVALGHEQRDVSTRVVVFFAVSLVVGAVLIHVAVWLVYMFLGGQADRAYPREYPMAKVGAPAQPPTPRLQTQPREELKALRAAEERRLSSYGWVNPSGGIVHVPIEQAMKTTLERGLPARSGGTALKPALRPERSNSGRTGIVAER